MTDGHRELTALEQRRRYINQDIEELAGQVAAGEIEIATADRLREAYALELAEVEAAIASVDIDGGVDGVRRQGLSTRRAVIGTVALASALTVAIVFIGGDTVPSQQGAAAGVDNTPRAAPEIGGSLDTMEQVVAENPDNVVLRLAVADVYYRRAQYSQALSHYLAVLESAPSPVQESIALGRVGWMAFITSQLDAANDYVSRSLQVDPDNVEAKMFLGYVRFMGFDDPEAAIPLLEEVLASRNLDPDLRAEVEGTLASARAAAESG